MQSVIPYGNGSWKEPSLAAQKGIKASAFREFSLAEPVYSAASASSPLNKDTLPTCTSLASLSSLSPLLLLSLLSLLKKVKVEAILATLGLPNSAATIFN